MPRNRLADPRAAVAEVTSLLTRHLGSDLLGLYLFGSLAAGAFVAGRSDLDLCAVVAEEIREGERLDALESLHASFVSEHPEWRERVEVGYVSRAVLATFGAVPSGRMAAISPGEPLHVKDAGYGWVLNWRDVCTRGETLLGPPPLELGPRVAPDAYRRAIGALLEEWEREVAEPWVAYVPAHQGYIVVTLCRALYGLETGEHTTKEHAAAWAAERYPEWAGFVEDALARHRADVDEPHRTMLRFVDHVLAEAGL